MATTKKVTKVSGGDNIPQNPTFVPTAEAKGKATQLRLYAVLLWILAIAAEVGAIFVLLKSAKPIVTSTWIWMISLIVVDAILVAIGSQLWKKSNRLDPASKREKVKFFIQNQLGVIITIIAFLPLVLFIFTNKDLDGKQKGIIGGIAVIAMIIAGISSVDFNPPSVEEYSQQSTYVKELMDADHVFWTKSGTKYHLYDDCQYLKSDRTTEIFEGGTVADAYANNSRIKPNINSLCSACEKRAAKAKGWTDEQLQEAKDKVLNSVKNAGTLLNNSEPKEKSEE
jgi:hypothetical protein